MLQNIIYILCFATCLLCAILLGRAYLRTHVRLLLWSCLCFAFLSVNNLLLVLDLMVFPETEVAFLGIRFAVLRSATALIGVLLLVFGLIWEATE